MAHSSGAEPVRRSPLRDRVGVELALVARPESAYLRWGKRLFDLVVGGIATLLALPVMAVVAVLVLATMGRPVLHRQQRVGRSGAPFVMCKFRTMRPDRRVSQVTFSGPERRMVHKTGADPRHTPLGRVLRRTSLDELPQLLNVVKGDMSLVGPRPELWTLAVRHGLVDHPRHRVRPGITGPRQVSAERASPIYADPDLDLDYVRDVGLGTDLRVLGRTIGAVVRATGE